jgi:hypothetical protein
MTLLSEIGKVITRDPFPGRKRIRGMGPLFICQRRGTVSQQGLRCDKSLTSPFQSLRPLVCAGRSHLYPSRAEAGQIHIRASNRELE